MSLTNICIPIPDDVDLEELEERMLDLTIPSEFSRLKRHWYKRWNPAVFWQGIFSAEPWAGMLEGNYVLDGYLMEEWDDIWTVLLAYHWKVSYGDRSIRFLFDPESPVNGWLRVWSKHSNVRPDVELLYRTALEYLLDNYVLGRLLEGESYWR